MAKERTSAGGGSASCSTEQTGPDATPTGGVSAPTLAELLCEAASDLYSVRALMVGIEAVAARAEEYDPISGVDFLDGIQRMAVLAQAELQVHIDKFFAIRDALEKGVSHV